MHAATGYGRVTTLLFNLRTLAEEDGAMATLFDHLNLRPTRHERKMNLIERLARLGVNGGSHRLKIAARKGARNRMAPSKRLSEGQFELQGHQGSGPYHGSAAWEGQVVSLGQPRKSSCLHILTPTRNGERIPPVGFGVTEQIMCRLGAMR